MLWQGAEITERATDGATPRACRPPSYCSSSVPARETLCVRSPSLISPTTRWSGRPSAFSTCQWYGARVVDVLGRGTIVGVIIAASAVAWTGGASSVFALFATPTLKVTVLGRGTVTSSPSGINCPKRCSAHFSTNFRVRLTAHPAAGWMLFAWSGGCRGHRACVAKVVYREFVQAKFLGASHRPSNPG